MSIKLFGGFAKGFTLQTPSHITFRPTLTTLRRKFFDKYQDLSDYHFYDLCAGSAAVGLEAISHLAKSATFIEMNSKNFSLLKTNATKFSEKFQEFEFSINTQKEDAIKWMSRNLALLSQEENIIFFDPPYEEAQLYEKFVELLKTVKEIKAVILIEADRQKFHGPEYFSKDFEIKKIFEQGSNYILMI